MEESILKSTKKVLGVDPDNDAFDLDIITHINSAFFTLYQLGVGETDFRIEDATPEWDDFIVAGNNQNAVKTYVYLKVRMLFDPPSTSYLVTSFEKQIEQMEWRINETNEWVPPPEPPVEEVTL